MKEKRSVDRLSTHHRFKSRPEEKKKRQKKASLFDPTDPTMSLPATLDVLYFTLLYFTLLYFTLHLLYGALLLPKYLGSTSLRRNPSLKPPYLSVSLQNSSQTAFRHTIPPCLTLPPSSATHPPTPHLPN